MTREVKVYEAIPQFVRQSTGTKKVAPIDMRKEEHQFVIDGYTIDEVLNQIPTDINILGAEIWIMKRGSRQRFAVPQKLRLLGVTSMDQSDPIKRIRVGFDVIKRATLRKNIVDICTSLEIPFSKAYFGYIVLSNGEGAGKFKHCTKEIHPDANDLRKKLRVLGLTQGQGKVQSLVAALGAKKFKCTIKEEAVKMVMCSRE